MKLQSMKRRSVLHSAGKGDVYVHGEIRGEEHNSLHAPTIFGPTFAMGSSGCQPLKRTQLQRSTSDLTQARNGRQGCAVSGGDFHDGPWVTKPVMPS
jgi:hypothetical protein